MQAVTLPASLRESRILKAHNLIAGAEAEDTLMRGFTTVRDVGGPVFGLKRAIDNGTVVGPRIYPSGAVITVTSGHGDFRQLTDGGPLTRWEQIGGMAIADSPDEVRVRVREQLMQGASQIKLTAGGGVSSPFSPIDVVTLPSRSFGPPWSRPKLGHLRYRACLHARSDPAGHCGRSEVHRAWVRDGRGHREADSRQGHLFESAAAARRIADRFSRRVGPARKGRRSLPRDR